MRSIRTAETGSATDFFPVSRSLEWRASRLSSRCLTKSPSPLVAKLSNKLSFECEVVHNRRNRRRLTSCNRKEHLGNGPNCVGVAVGLAEVNGGYLVAYELSVCK